MGYVFQNIGKLKKGIGLGIYKKKFYLDCRTIIKNTSGLSIEKLKMINNIENKMD